MGYILTVIVLVAAAALGLFVRAGVQERQPPESLDLEMQKERIRIYPYGPKMMLSVPVNSIFW